MLNPILEIQDLKFYYPISRFLKPPAWVHAVDGVTLSIQTGETLGLVGESGCGKTTLARVVLNQYKPREGRVLFKGKSTTEADKKERKILGQKMSIVFQDPYSSLNPRMPIAQIITEPINIHKIDIGKDNVERAKELLNEIGLNPEHLFRYPHEFSGGQRQRIAIARALASKPEFIALDEPTSSVDVCVQAQVLNLLKRLQKDFGLTYLLISHNLRAVRHISDRVAVMYLGRLVEIGMNDDIFDSPQHPYTKALLSATPVLDPNLDREKIILRGEVPSAIEPPSGCRFHPRCSSAKPMCKENEPQFTDLGNEHFVRCHTH